MQKVKLIKNKKLAIFLILIISVVATGAFAIGLSAKSKVTTFINNSGTVKIGITQELNGDTYNETEFKSVNVNVESGQIVQSEPVIDNLCDNDISNIYSILGIPAENGNDIFLLLDKDKNEGVNDEWLFITKVNPEQIDGTKDYNYYLYCYNDNLTANSDTTPIFNYITTKDTEKNLIEYVSGIIKELTTPEKSVDCDLIINAYTSLNWMGNDEDFTYTPKQANEISGYAAENSLVIIPDGVTYIGKEAFKDNINITSLYIPSTVLEIKENAFAGCKNLTKIIYTGSALEKIKEGAFKECSSLSEIIIPDGVKVIENSAYENCASATVITIGKNIETIGDNSFKNCIAVTEINYNAEKVNDLKENNNAFLNTGLQDDSILNTSNESSISTKTLNGINKVKRTNINKKETGIKLRIGKGVKIIPAYLFNPCNNCDNSPPILKIDYVEDMPEELKIKEYSFAYINRENHDYTNTYVILKEEYSIDEYSFFDSHFALAFEISDFSEYIENGNNILDENRPYHLSYNQIRLSDMINLTIPDGVTNIGTNSFAYCKNLKSVSLPDSLQQIGVFSFYECTSLKEIYIPKNIKKIENAAFSNCTSVETINYNSICCDDLTINNAVFLNLGKNTEGVTVNIQSDVLYIPNNLFNPENNPVSAPNMTCVKFSLDNKCEVIGEYAFAYNNCSFFIYPPENVSISNNAFDESDIKVGTFINNLASWISTDGVAKKSQNAYFYNNENINSDDVTEIVIPEGVTHIGAWKFAGWTNLKKIVIPASVTSIGVSAFSGCTNIEEIIYKATNCGNTTANNEIFKDVGKNTTSIKLKIAANVQSIPDYLFNSCNNTSYAPNIEIVDFESDSVCTSIGEYSFAYIETLKYVYLTSSDCNISSTAFYYSYNCSRKVKAEITDLGAFISTNRTDLDTCYCINGIPLYELTSLEIPSTVTSIGDYVFYNCTSLTNVSIPSTVKKIGNGTFQCCESLKSIVIPNEVKTIGYSCFAFCSSLETITLSDSLATIPSMAFMDCSSLKSVVIPDSVNTIVCSAFQSCTSLETLTIGEQVTNIGSDAFYGCNKLKEIYYNAESCSNLSANNGVFYRGGSDGEGISVYVKNTVKTIPQNLFNPYSNSSESPKITFVSIEGNSSVACTIGSYSFAYGNQSMLVLKPSNCTVKSNAFYKTTVSYGEIISDIKSWIETDGNSSTVYYYNNKPLTECETFEIPADVTKIGSYKFYNCSKLTSVNVPDNITSIGEYSFYNCSKLTSVNIPQNTTLIGKYSFYNCSNITSITIPENVTSIGIYTFYNCKALKTITYNAVSCSNFSSYSYSFEGAGTSGDGITVTFGNKVEKVPAYLFFPSSNTPKICNIVFETNSSCTSIGNYAFAYNKYNNKNGLWYTAPDCPHTIGSSAFSETILNINISDFKSWIEEDSNINYNYFYNGQDIKTLESITLPADITTIGSNKFNGCSELKSIEIPSTVTSIGYSAFNGCTNVENINYNAVNCADLSSYNKVFTDVGKNTDGVNIFIGNSVERIPKYLFNSNDSSSNNPLINEISFASPSKCSELGDYSFAYSAQPIIFNYPDCDYTQGSNTFYETYFVIDFTDEEFISWLQQDSTSSDKNSYSLNGKKLINVIIPSGVTKIGSYKFNNNTSIKSIVIPDSVQSIGDYAFSACSKLETVTLGNGISAINPYTFYNCISLSSVNIPENAAKIDNYAFYNCSSIENIDIADKVAIIGNYAFYNCSSLKALTIGEGVQFINNDAFSYCKCLEEIHYNAINCYSFGNKNYIFYNGGKNTDGIAVTIGNKVQQIPGYLFCSYNDTSYNVKLKSLSFENNGSCTSIGEYSFAYCSTIELDFADISSIRKESSFSSTTIKVICSNDHDFAKWIEGDKYSSDKFNVYYNGMEISEINNLIIPNGTTKIGNYTFYYCSYLTSIDIPDTVLTIGRSAFYNCSSLTTISIGSGVQSIQSNAFYGNQYVTTLNFNAINCTSVSNCFYSLGRSIASGCTINIGSQVQNIPAKLFYPDYSSSTPKICKVVFASDTTQLSDNSFKSTISILVYSPTSNNYNSNAFGCNFSWINTK